MSHARWLCVASVVVLSACHGAKEPASTTRLTAAEAMPAPAQAERMSNCPNVVAGANTVVSEVPGGVELRITAPGEAASEIRKRALYLSSAAEETRGKHQGSGAGNAQFGRCPIVMRNTKIEVREIPGGAAVIVRPSRAAELDWLRREVESRTAQLAAPKPFGPGNMMLCPNAVANAETTITNTRYGVDVKVTESTPEGVRAIRERAKELASRGGARDDRCPLSVPDATLIVSEVPGGAMISVKAKRPDDVASIRSAVHERARNYASPAK